MKAIPLQIQDYTPLEAHLFQKNHRNGGKQEKTTKIHEFIINV